MVMTAIGIGWGITWFVYAADYTRFTGPEVSTRRLFGVTFAGMFVPVVWLGILGAYIASAGGGVDPAQLVIAAFGALALPVLLLILHGPIATNIVVMYSSVLAVLSLDLKATQWKIAASGGVVSSIVLWGFLHSASFANSAAAWMSALVVWISPWAAITLIDFFVLRHGAVDADHLYRSPSPRWTEDVDWTAMACLVAGLVAGAMFMTTGIEAVQGPLAVAIGHVDLSVARRLAGRRHSLLPAQAVAKSHVAQRLKVHRVTPEREKESHVRLVHGKRQPPTGRPPARDQGADDAERVCPICCSPGSTTSVTPPTTARRSSPRHSTGSPQSWTSTATPRSSRHGSTKPTTTRSTICRGSRRSTRCRRGRRSSVTRRRGPAACWAACTGAKRVGVELIDPGVLRRLEGSLPDVDFVPIGRELYDVRIRKTPEEIRLLEDASIVNSLGAEAGHKAAEAGATDHDILAAVMGTLQASGPEFLSHSLCNHRRGDGGWFAEGTVLGEGDPYFFDIGVYGRHGYASDIARTGFVGGDTRTEIKQVYAKLLKAHEIGAELAKPGVRASQIDDAVNDYLRSEGLPTTPYSMGHGVGLRACELPTIYRGHLVDRDQTLVENSVISLNRRPGIEVDGEFMLLKVEDNYVVERDGLRRLSPAGYGLNF